MDLERITQLLAAVMAVLGTVLAALGALAGEDTTVGFGLVAVLAGVVLYWAFGWFWDWYWNFLEQLKRGEIEPTVTLRASFAVLFVGVGTSVFVGLWWLAVVGDVVTDGPLAAALISKITVAGGVVPGVVLGGGFFAVAWVLRIWDAPLDVTKGSRGFQLIFAIVLCTFGAYCLLLFLHPPSAVAFAVAYLVSFVGSAAVYANRTADA